MVRDGECVRMRESIYQGGKEKKKKKTTMSYGYILIIAILKVENTFCPNLHEIWGFS